MKEPNLNELISGLREYWRELLRQWKLIALICLPFIAWQAYYAFTTPIQYDAKLTFMVDEQNAGGMSILAGLLGDIGLDSRENNYDKILELARSNRIMRAALFSKAEIEGSTDFLANHFIRIQRVREEEWYKKPKDPAIPSLNGFLFQKDSFERFSRLEYAAFKSIVGMLLGDEKHRPLFSGKYNQDSGIMALGLTTRSEELSIVLLRIIFERLGAYYVDSSTEKEQATYDIIRQKTDSLLRLLGGSEYRAAQFSEQSLGLIKPTDKVPAERFARNKTVYGLMYGEALKNLELADYALKDRRPYIQAVDLPIPPLRGYGYGKKKALLLGLGLGLAAGFLWVIGRKVFRENV